MPRPSDFGGPPEYGYEASFSYMRETIYNGSGDDIMDDQRLIGLFNNLNPEHDNYPSGSQDIVDSYIEEAFTELQDYLAEEYGPEYDLAEFWDYDHYGDWRANYDGAA